MAEIDGAGSVSIIVEATGSYTIEFSDGSSYHGKGGVDRTIQSTKETAKNTDTTSMTSILMGRMPKMTGNHLKTKMTGPKRTTGLVKIITTKN